MSTHPIDDSPIIPTLINTLPIQPTLTYQKVCDDHGWCIYRIVSPKLEKPEKTIHDKIDDLLSDITMTPLEDLSSQQDTLDNSSQ